MLNWESLLAAVQTGSSSRAAGGRLIYRFPAAIPPQGEMQAAHPVDQNYGETPPDWRPGLNRRHRAPKLTSLVGKMLNRSCRAGPGVIGRSHSGFKPLCLAVTQHVGCGRSRAGGCGCAMGWMMTWHPLARRIRLPV